MISIQDLTKYYGEVCAVDRVSFRVEKGEVLGLLGPNGAGKTTTMRILTCYLKPTSGTIRVKDIDIREDPVEVKHLIGYLPESAPLYPDMLTYEYLQHVAAIRGLTSDRRLTRIHELADLCGINEIMHMHIRELSRGYKQRVGLAHAMMSDPEILVLDEPTSGLDPNQIVDIRSIIREIGRTKTILFSTHILSEAEATCDRIVIINKGQVAADGTAEKLRASAVGESVIHLGLLDATYADVRSTLSRISAVKGVRQHSGDGSSGPRDALYVELTCTEDVRPAVYEAIKGNTWTMIEFVRESQSLESVFRDLTRADAHSKEK